MTNFGFIFVEIYRCKVLYKRHCLVSKCKGWPRFRRGGLALGVSPATEGGVLSLEGDILNPEGGSLILVDSLITEGWVLDLEGRSRDLEGYL